MLGSFEIGWGTMVLQNSQNATTKLLSEHDLFHQWVWAFFITQGVVRLFSIFASLTWLRVVSSYFGLFPVAIMLFASVNSNGPRSAVNFIYLVIWINACYAIPISTTAYYQRKSLKRIIKDAKF